MANDKHDDVFKLKPKSPQSKADITDETVRALLKEEAEERAAQTQKLRAARLAREAELPYAPVCMVTDYDCWREDHDSVDVASVMAVMRRNVVSAKAMIGELTQTLSGLDRTPSPDGIETVLDTALITAPDARDPDLVKRLDVIAGRVLG